MVDENLENYREIHGWLIGLGFPTKHSEYTNLVSSGTDRFPISTVSSSGTDPGSVSKLTVDQGPILSDATLTILTSKNNPTLEVRFKDLYPTALSGLSYDQQASDVTYLTADVTFSYLIYEFATAGSPRTTVTTS